MTRAELSESIRQFSMKWAKKGKEDEDDRSFWIDLFQRVLDVEKATDLLEFQKKVVVNNTTKKIDVYIPDTKVIIEQKSNNKSLDEKILQGDGEKLTPFEQAERYNNHLPHSEKARWIVTSNFKEIWIYDMDKNDREREPIKIELNALGDKHSLLKFLIKEDVKEITDEVAVSVLCHCSDTYHRITHHFHSLEPIYHDQLAAVGIYYPPCHWCGLFSVSRRPEKRQPISHCYL